MLQKDRYPVAAAIRATSGVLGVDPGAVLRRAGLPGDLMQDDGQGITATQFGALWRALEVEVSDPTRLIALAAHVARGPFAPALFAFVCSPDVSTGLSRLSLFKPLMAPVTLIPERAGDGGLEVSVQSNDPVVPLPPALAVFELIYLVECARAYTGSPVVPRALHLPQASPMAESLEAYFGTAPEVTGTASLHLSPEDAARPLTTRNAELWSVFEKDLTQQLTQRAQGGTTADRVRGALLELLPGGMATIEAVCKALFCSRRSLQRHLKDEGVSFQSVLQTTRRDLALHYLAQKELRIEEISYLLAYGDPNSFYRAFHAWTGITPAEARERGQTALLE